MNPIVTGLVTCNLKIIAYLVSTDFWSHMCPSPLADHTTFGISWFMIGWQQGVLLLWRVFLNLLHLHWFCTISRQYVVTFACHHFSLLMSWATISCRIFFREESPVSVSSRHLPPRITPPRPEWMKCNSFACNFLENLETLKIYISHGINVN